MQADHKSTGFFRKHEFSLALVGCYILTFHIWLVSSPELVHLSGLVISGSLGLIAFLYRKKGYFVSTADFIFHLFVIADLLFESWIPFHFGFSFYWCALAFSLVLGGYRFFAGRHACPPNVPCNDP